MNRCSRAMVTGSKMELTTFMAQKSSEIALVASMHCIEHENAARLLSTTSKGMGMDQKRSADVKIRNKRPRSIHGVLGLFIVTRCLPLPRFILPYLKLSFGIARSFCDESGSLQRYSKQHSDTFTCVSSPSVCCTDREGSIINVPISLLS